MRILVTIPHFFRTAAMAAYGSESGNVEKRSGALTRCLQALRQNFGHEQTHMDAISLSCNQQLAGAIDVVLCSIEGSNLLDHIPSDLCERRIVECDPKFLGYECHLVLAQRKADYDYFCFLEDDIEISDPLFFHKIRWFCSAAGDDAVLQPHRYEISSHRPVRKLYIDGKLRDPSWTTPYQNTADRTKLQGQVLGRPINFERTDNPHSGCFFLSRVQFERWMSKPYFLDRSDAFAGPLESAATLGVMRTFRVYKPSPENAGFLEVRHLDNRYLNNRVKFRDDFVLQKI